MLINRYVDGNPSEPGRVCAAQLCGLCHGHGDCIFNEATKNVTCSCVGGHTGEFCEIEPSKTLLLLSLILATLLLLLSLFCCLYYCSKLRCFIYNALFTLQFFIFEEAKRQSAEIIEKIFKN